MTKLSRKLQTQKRHRRLRRFLIGDSIEGWADAIKVLMKSYLNGGGSKIIFDYSEQGQD